MEKSDQGKQVLVIGLGLSGRAAARFLLQQGAHVHGVDRNQHLLEEHPEVKKLIQIGLTTGFDHSIQSLKEFDLIVVSPGVPQTHPLYQLAKESNIELLGEIELGCRSIHHPMIGITGTNGKTTVTLLVAHLLKEAGKQAKALGNVGVPLTQELSSIKAEEIIVLELSSYQLETFSQPVLDAAVILNITPDHLDRYPSMEAYACSKLLISRCLKNNSCLYIENQTAQHYSHLLNNISYRTYGFSSNCWVYTDTQAIYWRGKKEIEWPRSYQGIANHDIENNLAAYALCREFGVPPQKIIQALMTFKKPEHRLEFVREKEGVFYYNDSKGTNIEAVIRAVQFLPGPVILIAGGVDKGASYTPWLEVFANKVKSICAIGQAAGKMQTQLASHFPFKRFKTLEQAVRQSSQFATRGDYVLLSPGCASYDMFNDYAHRGNEFKQIVHRL
jgi:UDP-N-acetylmuramoylalanine--D-glutamate ligase